MKRWDRLNFLTLLLSRYQHLEATRYLVSPGDFFHKVRRYHSTTVVLFLRHLVARQAKIRVVMISYLCDYVPQGGEEDEKTRKKREKMERKASKAKIMKTRTR